MSGLPDVGAAVLRGLLRSHLWSADQGNALTELSDAGFLQTGDLRQRLSRRHADVDNAFKGWNGAWLDPDFRQWDATELLACIRVPTLIVQGEDDQYGPVAQIEAAERECCCQVEVALLPGAKHSPQREAPDATLRAISALIARARETNDWVAAA